MKLFFIRHGETTGDVENRYGGTYDDHLTEKGVAQSNDLGNQLKDKGIQMIFSSPLQRAQETADIIAGYTNSKTETEDNLKERNQYGILSGMIKSEAQEKHPDLVEMLKDRLNTIEGAESYEDFSERISESFRKIVNDSTYDTVAIVSHGGPLRVLFRDILKWGEIDDIGDCAFVELEKQGDTFAWVHSGGFKPSFQIPVLATK